jgi:predicted GNAT family acetyltransferase
VHWRRTPPAGYGHALAPTVRDNPERGRFEIWVDGELAGYSEYQSAAQSVIVAHTEIEKGHEGQGLASVLVREMLESIRESGRKVIPLCEFTAGFIRRNQEFIDLVPPNLAAQFRPRPGANR